MNSIYASDQIKQVIWPDFTAHFKNSTTAASYHGDICEIMNLYQKDFLQLSGREIADYYETMKQKVNKGQMQPSTLAKKMRELNSFTAFICENKSHYQIPSSYQNYFQPYMKEIEKISKYARSIPIEHIDQLLEAAQDDYMAYCIIIFIYRMGLSSTEIIEIRPDDFTAYDNGVYLHIPERVHPSFVPEDVYMILEKYLSMRQENEYLFYNTRGNKLNTMYISRMMKKYTGIAGIPSYSAEALRNSCAYSMFAYHASPDQVAQEMGVTESQIRRYNNMNYMDTISRSVHHLVKIKVEPPGKQGPDDRNILW